MKLSFWPRSLVGRVFALYTVTLLAFTVAVSVSTFTSATPGAASNRMTVKMFGMFHFMCKS